MHARDIAAGGWLPYRSAPMALNLYWTSLAVLDPATVILLLRRPRTGLYLALAVMISDVAVNSWAALTVFQDRFWMPALWLHIAFLALIVGCLPWLYSALEREGPETRRP